VSRLHIVWLLVRLQLTWPVLMATGMVTLLLLSFGRGPGAGEMLPFVLPFAVFGGGLMMPASVSLLEAVLPLRPAWSFLVRYTVRLLAVLLPVALWRIAGASGAADASTAAVVTLVLLVVVALTVPFMLVVSPVRAAQGAAMAGAPRAGVSPVRSMLAAVALAGVTIGLAFLSPSQRLGCAVALAVVTVGAAVRMWGRTSMAIPSASATASVAAKTGAGTAAFAHMEIPAARVGVLWMLLRLALPPWMRWMHLFQLGIVAMLGYFGQLTLSGWFWALVVSQHVAFGTRFMTALPWPAWRRLALMVAVGPLAAVAAHGAGGAASHLVHQVTGAQANVAPHDGAPSDPAAAGTRDNPSRVRLTFWRHASGGGAPRIAAPWGEQVDAFTVRILGLTFYNPFTVRESSSPQFTAWQWERLTRAVYGQPVLQERADPDAWPPLRTAHWPVRLMTASLSFTVLLLMTYAVWGSRQAVATVAGVAKQAGYAPAFLLVILSIASPRGADGEVALLEATALWLVDALPAGPLSLPGLLFVAMLPLLFTALLLWRAAHDAVLEFKPLPRG
jgi:hypothetical protein